MKRLLAVLVGLVMVLGLSAAPARRSTFTVTQHDGTQLTLMLVGDEYLHYYVDVLSGQRMQLGQDGDYHVIDQTEMVQRTAAAAMRRAGANARRAQRLSSTAARVGTVGNYQGEKRGLVILINYKDVTMSKTRQNFDDLFNLQGYNQNGHVGSVHDYFADQSYGTFSLNFDVVGPYTLANNMSYYGGNDASGNDLRPGYMAKEACNLANADVDFSRYDWDGDGVVDQVYIIYAGYGEAAGGAANTIWPHEWDLRSATGSNLRLDGVTVSTYACSSELRGGSGSNINPIGTACHEFSHCLGFPDMYDVDYSGAFGMNAWDVMDGGSYNGPSGLGEVPCGYTSYERMQAGWLTPVELTQPLTVTGMQSLGSSPQAYVIYNGGNSNEFFMLENRQASDRWFAYSDNYAAGSGMLIIHGDYSATAWANNSVNDDPSHMRMSIVPAGKNYGTYNSQYDAYYPTQAQFRGMLFPGSDNVTTFTPSDYTDFGGRWFTRDANNTYYSPHQLTQISHSGGLIGFLFDGGLTDDGSRYTVSYDAGTGTCGTAAWTQTEYAQATTLPTATSPSSDWTFVGWATRSVQETTTRPTLLTAGSQYTPQADVTLYAVYQHTEGGASASGTYTLDYSKETDLAQNTAWNYSTPLAYTALDGGEWEVRAYKNNGMQLNTGKGAYIRVPECPAPITSIAITASVAQYFRFAAQPDASTPVASSESATQATIDLQGKNLSTGYIYTNNKGATVITQIVVTYGGSGSGSTLYNSNPSDLLPTPTIAFQQQGEQRILLGGQGYANVATATGSTGAITYASSRPEVATVDEQGRVTALAVGQTTITATVAAVPGQSRQAQASYLLTVAMPALQSIALTTPPTTTTYQEGETFSPEGLVLTATYANGLTLPVTGYSIAPTQLTLGTQSVTLTYTEGGITLTLDIPLTVTPLPRYTVTLQPGTGTCDVATLAQQQPQEALTLPAATAPQDWTFAGWATALVEQPTTTRPTLLAAGSQYTPQTDVTLYAVYQQTVGQSERWQRVAVADVAEGGTYALITQDGHAFNGTISSGHGQVTSSAFAFDTDGYANAAPDGTLQLTLTASDKGYTLYAKSQGYLYAKDTKSGNLAWHASETSYWYSNSGAWTYAANKALLRDYQNKSFRTYSSTANGSAVLFARRVGGGTTTYDSRPQTQPQATLTGLELGQQPTRTTYQEGEVFSPEGLILTAQYDDGSSHEVTTYTYDHQPLGLGTQSVTLTYTEGSVTLTLDIPLTITPLPRYTVTFDAPLATISLTEQSHQAGVQAPQAQPFAGYTFVGWSTAQQLSLTDIQPQLVTLTDGRYQPQADVTLHAVYARQQSTVDAPGTAYTLTAATPGMPTAYDATGATLTVGDTQFTLTNVAWFSNAAYFQIRRSTGSITATLPATVGTVTVTYDKSAAFYPVQVSIDGTPVEPTADGLTYTFDCSQIGGTQLRLTTDADHAALITQLTITTISSAATYTYTTRPLSIQGLTQLIDSALQGHRQVQDIERYRDALLLITPNP